MSQGFFSQRAARSRRAIQCFAMPEYLRRLRPFLKAVLACAIVVALGWRFARDLRDPRLWQHPIQPAWLVVAGVLYVAGIGFSALFWYRLLRLLGQYPMPLAAARAYYVGQMGKYLPGKAWALLLRSTLVRASGVSLSVAAAGTLYEVLATMASGVLLAAGLIVLLLPMSQSSAGWPLLRYLLVPAAPQPTQPDRMELLLLALGLVAAVGIPLFPGVFNLLIRRLSSIRRVAGNAPRIPRVCFRALGEGLTLTGVGWLLLGLSLWTTMRAVLPVEIPWSWPALGRMTAYLALAYVAGFVIIIVPGGIGVREFLLTLFIVPEFDLLLSPGSSESRSLTLLVVLLLRLVWTTAEVLVAGVLYFAPGQAASTAPQGASL